jgi:hypothetical protein
MTPRPTSTSVQNSVIGARSAARAAPTSRRSARPGPAPPAALRRRQKPRDVLERVLPVRVDLQRVRVPELARELKPRLDRRPLAPVARPPRHRGQPVRRQPLRLAPPLRRAPRRRPRPPRAAPPAPAPRPPAASAGCRTSGSARTARTPAQPLQTCPPGQHSPSNPRTYTARCRPAGDLEDHPPAPDVQPQLELVPRPDRPPNFSRIIFRGSPSSGCSARTRAITSVVWATPGSTGYPAKCPRKNARSTGTCTANRWFVPTCVCSRITNSVRGAPGRSNSATNLARVSLPLASRGSRGDHLDPPRHHHRIEPLQQPVTHARHHLRRVARVRHHRRDDLLPARLPDLDRRDRRVDEPRLRQQPLLDLRQRDPLAADLQHPVAAPEQVEPAVARHLDPGPRTRTARAASGGTNGERSSMRPSSSAVTVTPGSGCHAPPMWSGECRRHAMPPGLRRPVDLRHRTARAPSRAPPPSRPAAPPPTRTPAQPRQLARRPAPSSSAGGSAR